MTRSLARFPASGVAPRLSLRCLWLVFSVLLCSASAFAAVSSEDEQKAQTVVHMLDYIGVDYPDVVQAGVVLDESEYAEQLDFARQSITLLQQIEAAAEPAPAPALLQQAHALREAIEAKADASRITALTGGLRADVMRVYALSVAPRQVPSLAGAAALYANQCAACHGASGHGDGIAGRGLEPAPSNFHDVPRMRARSLYGLYNTISLGVAGTSMRGFGELSADDRWALALYVGGLRATPEELSRGESAWKRPATRQALPDLKTLVGSTAADLTARHGADIAAAQLWLTQNPQALQALAPAPLEISRSKLRQSLQAYRNGDADAARTLAIGAYLDGFELIESALDNVNRPLRMDIEREMMGLRNLIGSGKPLAEVEEHVSLIQGLLDSAEDTLSDGTLSPMAAFFSALLILLREGLEAILVLAAIIALVRKTGREDALRYIHFGWMLALVLGGVTWFAATYLITVSGASREVTEGVTALFAAVMLLYVGYWLHTKSYAQAWQSFIREQVNNALGKRTLWAMAAVSFLAVYREIFEVILFYQALWVQVGASGHSALLAGVAAAVGLLVIVTRLILRYSVRLPLGPFFSATSGLLALLAVIFVGNGIAALQEAGVMPAQPVAFIKLPLLGIHPTSQGLGLQVLVLALVVAAWWLTRRRMQLAH
ncbi:MAG: cytochrome c/FTR1 family iron permease [Dokdonella sp.]